MTDLKKLVLMLSSEHDGEIVNAARAIGAALRNAGKDWHWLANLLSQENSPAGQSTQRASTHPPQQPNYNMWRDYTPGQTDTSSRTANPTKMSFRNAALYLLFAHKERLNPREQEFLRSMRAWRGYPTEKQMDWFEDIIRRFDVTVEW